MISFLKALDKSTLTKNLLETVEFYESLTEGVTFRFVHIPGALLIRGENEDGYFFPYPCFDDGADENTAFSALEEYALAEEIPLFYIDVPKEKVFELSRRYKLPEATAMDEEGESFVLLVKNELYDVDVPESIDGDSVSLSPISPKEAMRYGKICRSKELGKYWGYDYKKDRPLATCAYFVREIQRELSGRTALTLGIRYQKRLIGDVTYFHFDGKGGAEFSLRILPKYQGVGLGKKTLNLLLQYAKNTLHLSRLYAEAKQENLPSIRLMEKALSKVADGEIVRYQKDL